MHYGAVNLTDEGSLLMGDVIQNGRIRHSVTFQKCWMKKEV